MLRLISLAVKNYFHNIGNTFKVIFILKIIQNIVYK